MTEFRHSFRIYYEDTDAGGIVYHANYLRFAERSRSDTMRELGFECSMLASERSLLPVVRKMEIDFLMSAKLDDHLTVITEISEIRGSSFWMQQTMEIEGGICAVARVLLVCVDKSTGRPIKIPQDLRAAFEENRMMVH